MRNRSRRTQSKEANGKLIRSVYSFDNIFQPPSTNERILESKAKPVVASTVDSVNGVILTYGQTAAGKTHTMLGPYEDLGVITRSVEHVFGVIMKLSNRQFFVAYDDDDSANDGVNKKREKKNRPGPKGM